ncbi:thiamine phosphate synthase [Thiohalomonas denitrificans]|uniref:thiamine phosphate synthase n=1 Tax=Thiohalomonas denitrificans TaxID=415747 RepID=UPI0026EFE7F5|nr:thiamine phosphate synthase [Thiohalomonas denitrificans]
MNTFDTLRGLYAITDESLIPDERLVPATALAIDGGARVVQYRSKHPDPARRLWEAQDLVTLCRPLGIPLIVNDDVEIALQARAAGVHLGKNDSDIAAAREVLGPEAIIGVSCYDRLELALEAESAGADYVAFGSFFPSSVKPDAVRASPDLLRNAKARLTVPVVAIGGITADNGGTLVAAGADMLAVVSAVFGAEDIRAVARKISDLYE